MDGLTGRTRNGGGGCEDQKPIPYGRDLEPEPDLACCEHVTELWGPQEGCREFMSEPEATVRCEETATHRVTIQSLPHDLYVCQEHVPDDDRISEVRRVT